jgi:hypothetical protein
VGLDQRQRRRAALAGIELVERRVFGRAAIAVARRDAEQSPGPLKVFDSQFKNPVHPALFHQPVKLAVGLGLREVGQINVVQPASS